MPNQTSLPHVLFHSPISAPSRAVRLLLAQILAQAREPLEEAGWKIDLREIDLKSGEHRTDPQLAEVNPRRCVPCLSTPWGGIAESRAIMVYLAELADLKVRGAHRATFGSAAPRSTPALNTGLPVKLWQRAKVMEWLDWDQGCWSRAVSDAVYPVAFGSDSEPSVDAKARVVEQSMVLLDALGDRTFLLGEDWTLADISIAMSATLLQVVGFRFEGPLGPLSAWMGRMSELPGWWDVNKGFDQWRAFRDFGPKDSSDPAGTLPLEDSSAPDGEAPPEDAPAQ